MNHFIQIEHWSFGGGGVWDHDVRNHEEGYSKLSSENLKSNVNKGYLVQPYNGATSQSENYKKQVGLAARGMQVL